MDFSIHESAETASPADNRDVWDVPIPPGGWGTPWPQCVELARVLPSTKWTLVGGLMVQLHAAAAGLAVTRPTADVDIVLHIETGATTASSVSAVLAGPVFISIPNALGALVLKGAAYREDSRDKERHLDDAVVLCATIRNPLVTADHMKGSDKSRILNLHNKLADPGHRSWQMLDPADRTTAMDALRILAINHSLPPANRLKRG